MVGYYRKFTKDYSKIASPLFELTRPTVKWHWDSEQEAAFDLLKHELSTEPIMAYPDFPKEFTIETTRLERGFGTFLSQKQADGQYHMISYGGRATAVLSRNWALSGMPASITDRTYGDNT